MKLLSASILVCFVVAAYAATPLKKTSFRDACRQSLYSKDRPSLYDQVASLWGVKKKFERWQQVVDSAKRATEYSTQCAPRDDQFIVRVLIDENTMSSDACAWELLSSGGFIVVDEGDTNTALLISKPTVLVAYKKGALYINGIRLRGSSVRIIPEQGTTTIDGTTYQGEFVCMPYKDRVLCINCIELESYVGSVLSSESWPGWPIEVNKVFAVMSRSYVLSHMLSAQKAGRPYHVRNTNAHQNYHGVYKNPIIKEAVKQTAGIVLVYDNKPVLAMFDACCGGVIPAHISHGIDFEKEPYLARTYACTYCKQCKQYSWKKTMPLAAIEKHFKTAQLCNDAVHELHVVSRDKAGLAKTVHIKTKRGIVACKGKQIYSALPDVKSYAFDMVKRGSEVTISGYGHGHHLGLCQWGAREMVRRGYTYQQILSFYYPGTQLTCVR